MAMFERDFISEPFRRSLSERHRSFQAEGVHLWPVLSCDEFIGSLQQMGASGIHQLAIDQISDEIPSKCSASEKILLLMPVADSLKASEIAAQKSSSQVIATVDHFAQIELLQAAATKYGTTFDVLIAVNSGADFFGCRAGLEALQLALAIRNQPNLNLIGLSSEVPSERTHSDIGSRDPAIAALLGTKSKLVRSGIPCPFMHLRTHALVSPCRVPADWHVSFPLNAIPGWGNPAKRDSSATTGASGQEIVATVIARPSLKFSVIDCGRQQLGPASQIVLANGACLPVQQMDETRSVLCMSDAAVELTIGQQIQFFANSAGRN